MAEILKMDEKRLEFGLEYARRLILSGKVVAFPPTLFTVWAPIPSTWRQ